jgi:diketogulonate reductase-like aldo/keto reductase
LSSSSKDIDCSAEGDMRLILKNFGKTGRKVSEVGMGTYYDPAWIATAFLGWRRGAAAKVQAIEAGLAGGITLVDTAEIYRSEPLVARALSKSKRDDIFLATKVMPIHLHRDQLVRALEKSLRRLGTAYVDLYQVHQPNGRVPIAETMVAMEELVRAGKVRHVGVSNFNLRQTEEANSALPKSQLTSVQPDYSLINREIERDILPYCEKNGIAVLAYFPLGHGKLASNPKVGEIAKKYGKTTSQTALRWLARKKVVSPIPRASNLAHVQENVGASGWELEDGDAEKLDAAFA